MDFTKHLENKSLRFYGGGNGDKVGIIFNNEYYMLKFPPTAKDNKNISYTNSTISEYICCQIIQGMGYEVQETILGIANINNKKKIVVACKDFCVNGYKLVKFTSLKNSLYDNSSNGNGRELKEILEAIEDQNILDSKIVRKHFWNQFVIDAFIGNFDRHNGNWGFLINESTSDIKMAPIYDCGSSLYPQIGVSNMKNVINNEKEIDQRIYIFPNSSIKLNGKKINMYSFLLNTTDDEVKESICEVYSRINLNNIDSFISSIEEISEIEKEFYKKMLHERYNKIIEPAYYKAIGKSFEVNNQKAKESLLEKAPTTSKEKEYER